MKITAVKTDVEAIASLRRLFLQEANCQIRHNASHERGWSDTYLLSCNGREVGYGAVNGQQVADRDTVFEFYVLPSHRHAATPLFFELLETAQPRYIECQSNEPQLCAMLFEFARDINAEMQLFEDHVVTDFAPPAGVVFRRRRDGEPVFEHHGEPVGDFVLERKGDIVATGGFLLHYNEPFADLYIEVRGASRGSGLGSFLLQELKKQCYLAGRRPVARCNLGNKASQASLTKAGLRRCGFMLKGTVPPPQGA